MQSQHYAQQHYYVQNRRHPKSECILPVSLSSSIGLGSLRGACQVSLDA